ncbi:MAG: 5'/3'-nucleotidase SurE [Thermoprotei archaeon]|nr:MAG: 5'/3'-nucleotidase SurE [Thermoprotei archaeon]RLE90113.1 MAG: 5'/3'-nucleotidase SurE [Thermoprotei archaeon]
MTWNILVTNDDGIYSPGLRILYDAVKDLGNIMVVAPERPRSATSLSLTLHKPLRVSRVKVGSEVFYSVSGNPSDVILIAVSKLMKSPPDIVLSGINIGDNTSLQLVLASGTVGACLQAALMNIKAVAFSMAISSMSDIVEYPKYTEITKNIIRRLTSSILEKGFPEGVDVLNVNFPPSYERGVNLKITRLAKLRFTERIVERTDPRGRKYYWIYGEEVDVAEEDTDVHTVFNEKSISITPLSLNLHPVSSKWKKDLEQIVDMVRLK